MRYQSATLWYVPETTCMYHFMTLLKLRASVSDTTGPLLGSFHMVRSAFSTTLWQCAFTQHFRFFQIVLLLLILPTCFQRMMAGDRDREQIFKTTGPRLPNETIPAPLQSEWREFQKRKLCCRTLYNAKIGKSNTC
jgi:hypothetical protein